MKTFLKALSIVTLIIAAISLAPAAAYANVVTDPACNYGSTGSSTYCQQNGSNPLVGPDGYITKAIRIVSYIAGIAAVIMVIVSGFMFVTSGGDPSGIKNARSTITYAIVGLVVLVTAQLIVKFVLSKV